MLLLGDLVSIFEFLYVAMFLVYCLKYPYRCFSYHYHFLRFVIVVFVLVLILLLVGISVTDCSRSLHFFRDTLIPWIIVSIQSSILESPLPPLLVIKIYIGHPSGIRPCEASLIYLFHCSYCSVTLLSILRIFHSVLQSIQRNK